jgi:hypothetical protein
MTGATRRDFIKRIRDGMLSKYPERREKLSEWMGLALQKLEKAEAIAEAEAYLKGLDWDEFLALVTRGIAFEVEIVDKWMTDRWPRLKDLCRENGVILCHPDDALAVVASGAGGKSAPAPLPQPPPPPRGPDRRLIRSHIQRHSERDSAYKPPLEPFRSRR